MSKTHKLEMSIPNQRGRSQPMLGKRRSQKRARRLSLEAAPQDLKAAVKYTRLDLGKDPKKPWMPWESPSNRWRKRNAASLALEKKKGLIDFKITIENRSKATTEGVCREILAALKAPSITDLELI